MNIACGKINKIWKLRFVSWRIYLIKNKNRLSCSRFYINNAVCSDKNALQKASIHVLLMLDPIWSPTGCMERNPCSMDVISASQNEIITIKKNQKQSSPEWDDISPSVVKTHMPLLITLLSPLCMYQTCLSHKVFFQTNLINQIKRSHGISE